jgi:hypothetical protein
MISTLATTYITKILEKEKRTQAQNNNIINNTLLMTANLLHTPRSFGPCA